MKRELVITKDNSPTLFVPELDEHYHSVHGALAESRHVFIGAGLNLFAGSKTELKILEMGFGTGLNAWLSWKEADRAGFKLRYHSLEKYPVTIEEANSLKFVDELQVNEFLKLHESPWQKWQDLSPFFSLCKDQVDLRSFEPILKYDLVYFDAFAPSAQSELWTKQVFEKLFKSMEDGGILVTYCVKGEVRRNMKAAGFEVEKIPGPPGKREMARARKPYTLT